MIKFIFRADGGSKIGFGHIMRSTLLAQKLSNFAKVTFVCKNEEEFREGINYIKGKDFSVIETDSQNLLNTLSKVEGDCLITDSYDVNEEYFDKTKNMFKFTGYIDDLNKFYFNVDFILNQNIYAEDLKYIVNPETKLLLGPEYFLLRDEFSKAMPKKLKNDIHDILVTAGGSDANNLTIKIVDFIKKEKLEPNLHILIGPSFVFKEEIEKIQSSNIKTYFNPYKVSEIMLKCDLAVSACGGTIYELAACGIPTIGFIAADNQRQNAKLLAQKGAMLLCEDLNELGGILKSIKLETRENLVRNAVNIASKNGGLKAAEEILNLLAI